MKPTGVNYIGFMAWIGMQVAHLTLFDNHFTNTR